MERANARIIAATNRDLEAEAVTGGMFREDLFYRLNIVSITMPPLRERVEDIGSLVKEFTAHFCIKHRRRLKKFKPEVLSLFQTLRWPGNVRQLRNLVERLVVTVPHSAVSLGDLPASMHQRKRESHLMVIQPGMTLAQVEAELIRQTLLKVTSNREEAARALGISRRTLQYKIQRYHPRRYLKVAVDQRAALLRTSSAARVAGGAAFDSHFLEAYAEVLLGSLFTHVEDGCHVSVALALRDPGEDFCLAWCETVGALERLEVGEVGLEACLRCGVNLALDDQWTASAGFAQRSAGPRDSPVW